jgi:hypothetical protein
VVVQVVVLEVAADFVLLLCRFVATAGWGTNVFVSTIRWYSANRRAHRDFVASSLISVPVVEILVVFGLMNSFNSVD